MGQERQVLWAMGGGEPTTFITGTGVGRHTEDRVPLVIARREAKNTAYLWCVALEHGDEPLQVQSEELKLLDGNRPEPSTAAALHLRLHSQGYVLLANPSGEPVVLGAQQVQGKIVLLTETADGASHIRYAAK